MKRLLLMRHAKSDWDHPHLSDSQRPLNARGKQAATRMGQWLAERQWVPDCILVSPAARARQTLELLTAGFPSVPPIHQDDTLYPGSPQHVMAALGRLPETIQSVLLLGHNPSLEVLVQQMGGEPEHFPTAAVAEVNLADVTWELAQRDWPRFLAGCQLANVWRPRVMFS